MQSSPWRKLISSVFGSPQRKSSQLLRPWAPAWRFIPRLEVLEDRLTPATMDITGTTLTFTMDPGAIASMSGSGNNLTFDAGLGNTITLTGNAAGNGFTGGSETSTGSFTTTTAITQIDIVGNTLSTFDIDTLGNALPALTIASSVTGVFLFADVGTTGTQIYNAPVDLGSSVNLTGSTVTFGSTVNDSSLGSDSLTVTGAAFFDGDVGDITEPSFLHVTLGSTISSAAISTTGAQAFDGPVRLTSHTNLTATTVTFGATVDDGNAPGTDTLLVTGDAIFDGVVGGITALQSVAVTGTSAIDASAITTTGVQAYDGAVTIGANTNLTSTTYAQVTFGSTVDGNVAGADSLTVTSGSVSSFSGTIGGLTPLNALNVNTLGAQNINKSVIANSVDFNSDILGTGAGNITFASGITIDATTQTYEAGNGTFNNTSLVDFTGASSGTFANTAGLANPTNFTYEQDNGISDSEPTASQYFSSVLTGMTLTISSPTSVGLSSNPANVDGTNLILLSSGGNGIYLQTSMTLDSLVANSPGGISPTNNPVIATTVGGQTYTGFITLSTDTTFDASAAGANGIIKIISGVSNNGSVLDTLTVDSGSTINGSNGSSITGGISDQDPNDLTALAVTGGTVTLNGAGQNTYSGPTTIGVGAKLIAGALDAFSPTSAVSDSGTLDLGGFNQTIQSFSGSGDVNLGTNTLNVTSAFSISGNFITQINGASAGSFGNVVAGGAATITGSTLVATAGAGLAGGAIKLIVTPNPITGIFTGHAESTTITLNNIPFTISYLNDAVTLTSPPAATVYVDQSFAGTPTGSNPATSPAGLTLQYGYNAFSDIQSALNNLASGGTIVVFADTNSYTGFTVNNPVAAFDINQDPQSPDVSGLLVISSAVTLDQNAVFTQASIQPGMNPLAAADLQFDGNIDTGGTPESLTINGNASTDSFQAIGTTNPLLLVDVASSSQVTLQQNVTTNSTQIYAAPVAVDNAGTVTLTGTTINFGSTVQSQVNHGSLTIAGAAVFNGIVGGAGLDLTNLQINGAASIYTTGITDTGVQDYKGAVTLGSNADLTSTMGAVTFESTVNGTVAYSESLTVSAAGQVTFDGSVGAGAILNQLAVTGASILFTANAADAGTAEDQTYNGAVQLNNAGGSMQFDSSAASGDITFNNTLDSLTAMPINVSILNNAGEVTFDGAVGSIEPVGSLDITGGSGTIAIDGASVTTAGSQTYGGPVDAPTSTATTTLTATGAASNIAFSHTITLFQADVFNITADHNISFAGDVSGGSTLNVQAGASGVATGTVSFTATGITVGVDTQSYRGGNGTSSSGVNLITNSPTFTGSLSPNPVSFTYRQDAAIVDAEIPAAAQFSGGLPTNYFIISDEGALTVAATAKVTNVGANTALLLSSNGPLTIDGAAITYATVRLQSLNGDITQTVADTITAATLGVKAADNVELGAATNDVTGLVAGSSGPITYFVFKDSSGFTIGSVAASSVFPQVTGMTADSVGLTSTVGTVTQTGAGIITSSSLGVIAATGVNLGLANAVGTTGGSPTAGEFAAGITGSGAVTFTDVPSIDVTTVAIAGSSFPSTTGINGGGIALISTGNIDLNAGLTGSPIDLSSAAGALTFGGANTTAQVQATIGAGQLQLHTAAFVVKLVGSSPGMGYDQLVVPATGAGAVALGSTTNLQVNLGAGFTPTEGEAFEIINNQGTQPISGAFAGLPEGTTVTFGGVPFRISYAGGSGNDVVLTAFPASVVTNPTNQTVDSGKSATFTATGNNGASVQWQFSTNGGVSFTNLSNGGIYSGVTTTTLTISSASLGMNNYQYRAVFGGGAGTAVSAAATLTVVSQYADSAYMNAFDAYYYAHNAYVQGTGSYNAMNYAYTSFYYAYYAYYDYTVGETASSQTCAYYAYYYGYYAAYYASVDYVTGSKTALNVYNYAFAAYTDSYQTASGF